MQYISEDQPSIMGQYVVYSLVKLSIHTSITPPWNFSSRKCNILSNAAEFRLFLAAHKFHVEPFLLLLALYTKHLTTTGYDNTPNGGMYYTGRKRRRSPKGNGMQ